MTCTSLFISVQLTSFFSGLILLLALPSFFTFSNKRTIINDLGKIYFFENRHEIKFHLNFSTIIANANAINDCIDRIAGDCDKIFSNKNCKYFIDNLHYNQKEIHKDIAYLKSQRRLSKRTVFLIPVALGVGIMALIALISSERASINLQRAKALSNLEILDHNLNISSEFINVSTNSLKHIISEMKNVRAELNAINTKVALFEEFNDILHIISLSLITHYNNANKFSHFFTGNLNNHFFSIIDIIEFNTKMDILRSKLDPKFLLPPLNPYDLIKSSQIFSNHNTSHISISLFIPLLNRENLTIFEFLPIPFESNNETFIWDTKPHKFYNGNNNSIIKIIPEDMLNKCFQRDKITICNSLNKEMTYSPDKCTYSSIKLRNNENCKYKIIPNKNYIFHISSHCLYFHIVKPISLKLTCLEKTLFFNVTSHSKIQLEKYCEIFEYSNMHYDSDSPTILSTNDLSAFPHLQIYDKNTKKWSDNIEPLEKNKIHLISLIDKTENARKEIKVLKDEIDNSMKTKTVFSFLDDFWDDSINKINWLKNEVIINAIIICLIPVIFYVLIKILCCTCKKRSTS